MPNSLLNTVLQQLHAIRERDGDRSTDGELLTRFLNQRDDDALAALVKRHAPMVWGVCRRVLRNTSDAEDAFQATFLVLVRKAGTVAPREMVANWLYGVAHQTAVRLRVTAAKRGVREMQLKELPEQGDTEAPVSEWLPLLDQELSRLPEQSRVLIVLCDLEGKTRKEAARQLGCPEGTVASRLARARELLAKRMARHGLAVSGGSLAAILSQTASLASVPDAVMSNTIHVANLFAANQAGGAISGSVVALTEGVLKTMLLKKIMTMTVAVLALGVAVITGGTLALGQTGGTGKPSEKPPVAAEKPSEKPPAAEKPLVAKVAARDVVVNTPTILSKLVGDWELQTKAESEYKQRLRFTTWYSGDWQQSERSLPMTITYYVEGQELLIQHNYASNGAFNYRLKQLRFEYAISNDKNILTLTVGDKTQTWKRIPKANPKQEGEKVAPEKEPFTAWGEAVGGLQAGLGFKAGEKRAYHHGETVTLVVRVRNVGTEEVKFQYLRQFFAENPPRVTKEKGDVNQLGKVTAFGVHVPREATLAAGKEIELYEWTPYLGTGSEEGKPKYPYIFGTGKFHVQYEKVLGDSSSSKIKIDPALEKLATGKLELEVKEKQKEPFTAWGKEVGGLQAGLGFKAGEKRAYHHGETVTLVIRVRNVSTQIIKVKSVNTYPYEKPPIVVDADGKTLSILAVANFTSRSLRTFDLEPGKEVDLNEYVFDLGPDQEIAQEIVPRKPSTLYGVGKFRIQFPTLADEDTDRKLNRIATGKLELEVKEPEQVLPKMEPFTAWGKEVGGLQAGLELKAGEKRAYRHGETVTLIVRVRNVSKEAVKFKYIKQYLDENPPIVTGTDGKTVPQHGYLVEGLRHEPVEVNLEPGKEIVLESRIHGASGQPYELRPVDDRRPLHVGTGKVSIQYERVFGSSSIGRLEPDPVLSKLATGKLELEVKDKPPADPAAKPKPDVKKVYTPDELVREKYDAVATRTVEFKVVVVTKPTGIKQSPDKDAPWVVGHGPDDLSLLPYTPKKVDEVEFSVILSSKVVEQLKRIGITDVGKHFDGKTIRASGRINQHRYLSDDPPEEPHYDLVIEDVSQIEAVK